MKNFFAILSPFLLNLLSRCSGISNYLKQYEAYRKISTFNTNTSFYSDISECEQIKQPIWYCAKKTYEKSMKTSPLTNKAPLWQRKHEHLEKHHPNCYYEIQQIMTNHSPLKQQQQQRPHSTSLERTPYLIHLRIRQSNCNDTTFFQKTSLLGGSSFHILSEGFYQQTCDYYDHFNNYYDVICQLLPSSLSSFSIRPNERETSTESFDPLTCSLITIILDYEHYDAYNEFTANFESPSPPLEAFLLNRYPFCIFHSLTHRHTITNALPLDYRLVLMRSATSQHHYLLPPTAKHSHRPSRANVKNSSLSTMIVQDGEIRFEEILQYFHHLDDTNIITNGVWKLSERPDNLSHLFQFASNPYHYQWEWLTDLLPPHPDVQQLNERLNRSFQECIGLSSIHNNNDEKVLSQQPPKWTIYPNYYFFGGESHLRYAWDSFVESIDPTFVATLGTKHNSSSYENLQSLTKTFIYQLSHFLPFACNKLHFLYLNQTNITFILQTGTWDITYWPLREIIENPTSSLFFLNIIKELLLDGENHPSCYEHISQILWLDTVVYPYCQQRDRVEESKEHQDACHHNRQGRNNYAILGLNDYFENQLKKWFGEYEPIASSPSSSFPAFEQQSQRRRERRRQEEGKQWQQQFSKLKFIQTRQIFLPRLLVVKYVCKNHYLCREVDQYGQTVIKSSSSVEGLLAAEAIKRMICAVATSSPSS